MIRQISKPLRLTSVVVALAITATAASAECFADYKAKKDDPLRLHYGVVELRNGCDKASAQAEIKSRIAKDGWKLLNVLSVFDETELSGKEASAGQFYLLY